MQAQAQLHLLEQGVHPEQTSNVMQSAPINAIENYTNIAIASPQQSGLFDALPNPAMEALKKINPDNLSPREALEQLYRLKELYTKGK